MTLLNRVERHLKWSGMTATAFGRAVMNDGAFVRHLRNGREPQAKTAARVLAFIAASERQREPRR